jgi:hypothetical protein
MSRIPDVVEGRRRAGKQRSGVRLQAEVPAEGNGTGDVVFTGNRYGQ